MDFSDPTFWVAIAFLGMCAIVGYIYVITADVYVQAFAGMASDGQIIQVSLGSGTIAQTPLLGPVLAAPVRFVEFLINRFETTSAGLAGFGLYLIIQTLELIPTVVWESPALMLHLIERLDAVGGKRVVAYKGDPDLIKQLKKRHNEYYSNLVESLNDWRLIAFTVDIILCFTLVKFIKVGTEADGSPILGRFFEGVSSIDFGFHSFHGPSTLKVLSSLFLLLILVKLGMKIFNGFGAFAKKIED